MIKSSLLEALAISFIFYCSLQSVFIKVLRPLDTTLNHQMRGLRKQSLRIRRIVSCQHFFSQCTPSINSGTCHLEFSSTNFLSTYCVCSLRYIPKTDQCYFQLLFFYLLSQSRQYERQRIEDQLRVIQWTRRARN